MTRPVSCPVCGVRRQVRRGGYATCSGCRRYTTVTADPADALRDGRWVTKPGGIHYWEQA